MSTTVLPIGGEGPVPLGDSVFDARYYAGVLWRGRWLIVVAAILGIALTSLVAYLQIPEYQAQALVQIEPPVPFFMGVNEALMGGGGTGRTPTSTTPSTGSSPPRPSRIRWWPS